MLRETRLRKFGNIGYYSDYSFGLIIVMQMILYIHIYIQILDRDAKMSFNTK